MAKIYDFESRTFDEYLLIPNYQRKELNTHTVSLKTPIVRYRKGEEESPLSINIPLTSAVMQAVSDDKLAIALAREGGLSFIYGSQSIESQAAMIHRVKRYKAGLVFSDSNLTPENDLQDVLDLKKKTGHSTVAITDDGSPNGKLLGLVTSRDYRISRLPRDTKVKDFMTPFDELITAPNTIDLSEANDIIWDHKLNQLPLIDEDGNLVGLVFRKDYNDHKANPLELTDDDKSLLVGAGINTRDYKERVPALLDAGVDVLVIDSSDGFTEWQYETLRWVKDNYGDQIYIGAGNVVDEEGFKFLADAGADFIKVGIGGGSICITREQKGIGMGQATAVQVVSKARDEYFEETGEYIPLCSDGGIVYDNHIAFALAMGADFVMLGRYFARFDESPSRRLVVNNTYVKEYWGEGSDRARNWQRYDEGTESGEMVFEEGVDAYVPYAGSLAENVATTTSKVKSTMVSCGAMTIEEFQKKARLVRVSSASITEGGAHDVMTKNKNISRS